MKTLCAFAFCLFFAATEGAAKQRHCTFRLHAQANPRDTEVFATSVRAQVSGKNVAIEKMPWISERDVIAFSSYPAANGTYGALLQLDAHGRVVNIKQVLTSEEFGQAKIGQWTTQDVLVRFGRPAETAYFPLMRRHVWSYRFLQDGVWYSMMHFYFDPDGVLRLTQVTPDSENVSN